MESHVLCQSCREKNSINFSYCWKCGGKLSLEKKKSLKAQEIDLPLSLEKKSDIDYLITEMNTKGYTSVISLLEFIKNLPSTIKEFKGAIIILIAWLIVSEIAGYSIIIVFRSIFRIILYPLNWVLFKTSFKATGIPEVFLLLMPLVILLTVSFLVIIYTED